MISLGFVLCSCRSTTVAGDISDSTATDGNSDLSLSGRRFFPADNTWNRDVSGDAVDANSDALIATCGSSASLHPDFGTSYLGSPIGIPYVIVRSSQVRVPVSFQCASESDAGPYPIPSDAPIEGGAGSTGDRHVLIVDVDAWKLYELFDAHPLNGGASWTAGSGAIFDLNSNALRPAGWTSADAAGLPILPGLVRYDEVVEQKAINHALRFTCPTSRRAYVSPARHFASSRTDINQPPMGMRVRLKASVNIGGFPQNVQVILKALKKYGMFLADNGSSFYLSGTQHPVERRRAGRNEAIARARFRGRENGCARNAVTGLTQNSRQKLTDRKKALKIDAGY